jgi:hypothetical protein
MDFTLFFASPLPTLNVIYSQLIRLLPLLLLCFQSNIQSVEKFCLAKYTLCCCLHHFTFQLDIQSVEKFRLVTQWSLICIFLPTIFHAHGFPNAG